MDKIEFVYTDRWLVDEVAEAVDKVRSKITDTSILEERIYNRLGSYINKEKAKLGHRRYLMKLIYEEVSQAKVRQKKEFYEHFSEFDAVNTSDGSTTEFEPEDVLADVEGEVIAKEMTALLAQDDQRKLVILGSWTIGNDNNTEISRLLAQSVGGKIESHRKFIQRFRNECREKLATAN